MKLSTYGFWIGFPGSDEVDTHSVLVGPLVEGLACELGPVVYQQGLGFATV